MGLSMQGELRPIDNAYPRLIEALDAQVRLLHELESTRDSQRAAIDHDEPDAMLEVLDVRQKLVEALTTLDREISALRSQVESQGTRITALQRDELARRAGVVAQAIQRVLLGDAEDGEALERRRVALKGEIEGVQDSRRAMNAYRPGDAGDSGARFQDRRA